MTGKVNSAATHQP